MKRGLLRRCWRSLFTARGLLLLIAPPTLLLLWVYGVGVASAGRLAHFDDWWSRPKSVKHHVAYQFRALARTPAALVLERRLDPETNAAGMLRLEVDRSLWDEIRRDPQAMFGVDIKANVLSERGLLPVDLRVRGDTSVHWTTEKISFTLQTRKEDRLKGHRKLAFSGKEVLNQHLAACLAEEFGLLAPRSSIVDVFLHDRFYGIYRSIEIPDESFLRRRNRLPGEIFQGDTAERGEVYPNVPRWLFLNPAIWERSASGGLKKDEARREIAKVLKALHEGVPDGDSPLLDHFVADEIGRLMAYLLIVGDPYHQSDIHNQYWYRDPSTARWHPIPWDVFVRDLGPGHGETVNELLRNLMGIPQVWDSCLLALRNAVDSGRILERTKEILYAAEKDHGNALTYDRLRAGAISNVGDRKLLERVIASNLRKVEKLLERSAPEYAVGRPAPERFVIDVVARGPGFSFEGIELRSEEGLTATEWVGLASDANCDGRLDDEEKRLARTLTRRKSRKGVTASLAGQRLRLSASATAPKGVPRHESRVTRLFVLLRESHAKLDELELSPIFRSEEGDLSGRRIADGATIAARPAGLKVDSERDRVLNFSENTTLTETMVIPVGTWLKIEPGISVVLAADVSLIVEGGMEARNVSFRPVKEREPWGSVVLRGWGSRSSRLDACSFEGGSSAHHDGIHYKGMVSVHESQDVRFFNCRFRENLRSDDCLNVVRSSVTIEKCKFHDANADALDLDLSQGDIVNCVFLNSGNDAIDLMGSQVVIAGNEIRGSGDKGISVGEGSDPFIVSNLIERCQIGIEVKDCSAPWLLDNTLRRNRIGVNQKHKNWRYAAGGFARWVSGTFEACDDDLLSDGSSRFYRALQGDRDVIRAALHRETGLTTGGGGLGVFRLKGYVFAPESLGFEENWDSRLDGWDPLGGARRIGKRGSELVVNLGDREGGVRCAKLPPELSHDGLFVWEIGMRDLASLEVSCRGKNGEWKRKRVESGVPWAIIAQDVAKGFDVEELQVIGIPKGPNARLTIHRISRLQAPE